MVSRLKSFLGLRNIRLGTAIDTPTSTAAVSTVGDDEAAANPLVCVRPLGLLGRTPISSALEVVLAVHC